MTGAGGVSRFAAAALAACSLAAAGSGSASAAVWHLVPSFGRHGVAGLPLREHREGTLLASGPGGSVFVGGYANGRRGALLLARMSAGGTLMRSFGDGGVSTVPTVYAFAQDAPRVLAYPAGGLAIVGLDRSDHLAVARIGPGGRPDRAFGHDGVADYGLPLHHGFAIVTAATVEPNGDILAAYQKEAPQPADEPAIPAGLGEGQIGLVRLLASGALDRSFGTGGFLQAPGPTPALAGYPGGGAGFACRQSLAPAGTLLLAYEQAVLPDSNAVEVPAVQQLGPTGADATGFGIAGAVFLPFVPMARNSTSSLCDGLYSLPGGAVEAAFGGEGQNSTGIDLFRFTATGAADSSFGTAGHVTLGAPVAALALAADGETFSAGVSGSALVLTGTLSDGSPDPALGGSRGERVAIGLSRSGEQQPTLEALPVNGMLTVRVGEELVRLVDK